jgi:hypothetical protein
MKKTLYINSHCTLQRDQNTLLLEMEDGTKRYLPVEGIRELHIFSEVNLNKRVLEFLSQNQIIVHFYNYYGYYTGSYYPREHFNSGYMLLKQARGGQHPVSTCYAARLIWNARHWASSRTNPPSSCESLFGESRRHNVYLFLTNQSFDDTFSTTPLPVVPLHPIQPQPIVCPKPNCRRSPTFHHLNSNRLAIDDRT